MIKLKNRITLQPMFDYRILLRSLLRTANDASIISNSARSSFDLSLYSILKQNKYKSILIPDFICSEIIPIIQKHKLNIIFYSINETLDPDIDIEIFRNPPIFNNEYIELLELLSNKCVTIPIYQIQTIYAKYHPRANEHFVIEEKLKTVEEKERRVDQIVEMKSRQTRKELEMKSRQTRKELEKEKENYGEKIKQVNEEKLKRIFSMFILRNERKENIKDKSTIREMIKHSNDKCKKKEQEQEIRLKTQQQELNSERIEFEKEKEDYENTFKSKAKLLLDIANDINEINELQEDTTEKSEELFNLMKQLNGCK